MYVSDISLPAVFLATLASMIIGMVWFHPKVFGKEWMKLSGIKEGETEKEKKEMKKKAGSAMFASILFSFLMAYVFSFVLSKLGFDSVKYGVKGAVIIWTGFVVPISATNYLYSQKPLKLWMINFFYWLSVLLAMGIILTSVG